MSTNDACPICDSPHLADFQQQQRALLICAHCRHVFWRDKPDPCELAQYYETLYAGQHNQFDIQASARSSAREHLIELLNVADREANQTRIADHGCSFPFLLIEAKDFGFRDAIGIDYDQGVRDYGHQNGIRMVCPDDVQDCIPDETIDVLRFSHILEHAPDPLAVLTSLVRKVTPDGLVFITQPNIPVFACEPCSTILKNPVWPEHLHFFSPVSLRILLERAGLHTTRFWTCYEAEAELARYAANVDLAFAAERMRDWASLTSHSSRRADNYPVYAGENSVAFAFRETAPPIST